MMKKAPSRRRSSENLTKTKITVKNLIHLGPSDFRLWALWKVLPGRTIAGTCQRIIIMQYLRLRQSR